MEKVLHRGSTYERGLLPYMLEGLDVGDTVDEALKGTLEEISSTLEGALEGQGSGAGGELPGGADGGGEDTGGTTDRGS
jgi:hypothetical protein